MEEKTIISNYMRALAKKSHAAIKAKYGTAHYSRMGKKARENDKKKKPR